MLTVLAASPDVWAWEAHPPMWLLVAAFLGCGWYAVHVIGPKAVGPGEAIVARHQVVAYLVAAALLWFAIDWPLHDLAEEYLYSAHMVQHFILTMLVAPLVLYAMPEWLARLIVSRDGTAGVWIRRLAHPLVAGFLFNVVVAVSHTTTVVNTSAGSPPFHYVMHLLIFSSAMLMWTPIMAPLPELRMVLPAQMVYLFLMTVIPTIPAAWLTFADQPVYRAYDQPVRVWGISVANDQQAAGMIMKVIGGGYLWVWIAARFFAWSAAYYRTIESEREIVSISGPLTYSDVEAEFARTPGRTESPQ